MQAQGGYPVPPYEAHVSFQENHYHGEDEVQSQMAGYYQRPREEAPHEREVGIDMLTNYATDQPHEPPFNFSPNYDPEDALRRSVSVFDRISPGQPRNRSAKQSRLSRNRP